MDHWVDRTVDTARGTVAGVAATGVMSVVMEAGRRLTPFRRQPPTLIVRTLLTGRPARPVPGETALALLAHFGYGAACGGLFGLLTRRHRGAGPGLGVGYGLLLWSISYLGWVPAFGAVAPPQHDTPGRQPTLVAGHVVYGVVLAMVLRRLRAAAPTLTPRPAERGRRRGGGNRPRPAR